MTPQTFGQQLRRHRDKRRITIDAVAKETKVSAGFLRALENGTCDRWPGGIYSRGFVRAYAHVVGLDPEDTVSAFTACYPAFAPEPVPDPASDVPPPPQSGLERLRAFLTDLTRSRRGASV
ncbi:MAG: helix-turn-helix transcriptional regulator [Vicinamibacterales bacterium]